MNFPWSHSHRRQELLAQPFPMDWSRTLAALPFYRALSNAEQQKLGDTARILIAEKHWEGCGGLTLTDEIQVTIAALAALLVLGFDDEYYPNVETVFVYPGDFLATVRDREGRAVITEESRVLSGQAMLRGPVVVSWSGAGEMGRLLAEGHSVVLHEFAHKMDMRDGAADGTPYLRDGAQIDEWARVMSAEYETLVQQTQAGEPALLRAYGATNAAEFFAVATEIFFGLPRRMQAEHADLYRVLSDYYRQDPAARGIG